MHFKFMHVAPIPNTRFKCMCAAPMIFKYSSIMMSLCVYVIHVALRRFAYEYLHVLNKYIIRSFN